MWVSELWRYPVKSLGGQRVTDLELGPRGVIGDRAFALVDARTGKVLTAKRMPVLLRARARLQSGGAEIVLPTGIRVHSSDPAVDMVLSAWLERPVHLLHTPAQGARIEEYGDDDSTFELPPWGFVDDSPLHLLSRATLRAAREWHPEGAWEVRRFRPNIVLDGAEEPPVDHHVDLGQAQIHVTGGCRRCVMITQPQEGLPADRAILRSVTTRSAANLGVYADVTHPGTVSLGDKAALTLTASAL
ncbi:MOSC domain-containing protein [Actinomadura fulvescens]|uniref:MOSC domain-containing protein n=2 Tax=Actinomadura fulvescens TaxID=46160 RepID=A0ABN3PUR1_9ACTN